MLDDGGVRERGEGAAYGFRNVRVPSGHALDMRLVDDRLVPGPVGPIVERKRAAARNHAFGHERRAVGPALDEVAALGADLVSEQAVVPDQRPRIGFRIRIEEKLVAVEAMSVARHVGAMDSIAVALTRPEFRHVAVPDLIGVFGQRDTVRLRAALVEQA